MKHKPLITFKLVYLIFLCLMAVLAVTAVIYVRISLGEYRDSLPERIVEDQIEALRNDAADGTLWEKFSIEDSKTGKFEKDINVREYYAELISGDEVSYALKAGSVTDSSQTYSIFSGEYEIAQVTLQRQGEERTKLFILTIEDWALEDVSLSVSARSYTIDVPYDLDVKVNGIELGEEDRAFVNGVYSGYEIKGLFFPPSISVTDKDGQEAEYHISGSVVKVVLFDYSLTLPRTLTVTVDGVEHMGDALSDGTVRHDIRCLSRPDVRISDLFGNTVAYEGGDSLDLTYISVSAPDNYTITADGVSVPAEAGEEIENTSLDNIRKYDPSVPRYYNYCIAVLKKDADIEIKDMLGERVEFDSEASSLELIGTGGLDGVPTEIAAEVDVLAVAKRWSLFMTKDLEGTSYGFSTMSNDLIEGSPLYDSAEKWVNSIDITFTSNHTLGNPPFSQETLTNFTRLSENSFYADVTLVKDMYVSGGLVPDVMNNRLYFVRYGGSWKLADMS